MSEEQKDSTMSRKDFLKSVGVITGAVVVGAVASKIDRISGKARELELGVEKDSDWNIPVQFEVSERIKKAYDIKKIGLNSEFDRLSEKSSENVLSLVFLKACHKAWVRYTNNSDVDFDKYLSKVKEAKETGNSGEVAFSIGGADLTSDKDHKKVEIDPLMGFKIVVADGIHEDVRMKMRIVREWSGYRKDDRVMKEDVSPIETKKDTVLLGYAKNMEGKLQLMFNLPNQGSMEDPISDRSLTERLMISLIMLRRPPTVQLGHFTMDEGMQIEFNSEIERESKDLKKLMFIDEKVGLLSAQK